MITPIFKVDQDEDYVYITIKVTNICKLSELEFYHDGNQFIFYCKPYHLKLEFPGDLISSDSIGENNYDDDGKNAPQISYQSETNELKIPIKKKHHGEYFQDLDLIGKLLAKSKTRPGKRLIEVLRTTPTIKDNDDDEDNNDNDEEEFDWTIEQSFPTSNDSIEALLAGEHSYGFANSYRGIINSQNNPEANELFDLKNPGSKTILERRKERLKHEMDHFDEEHYLADLYDDESVIKSMIESIAPWENWQNDTNVLTEEDRTHIIDHIPQRDFCKFDSTTKKALILGLFDIIFSYCYDLRTNDWEHTVESSWTIRKLSPTLSWFEFWIHQQCFGDEDKELNLSSAYPSLSTMITASDHMPMYMLICCIRRSLIYPLYRNWKLSIKIANDVINIIAKGRNAILKCLLDIHKTMANDGESCGQLINDLYLNDYACWVQKIKPNLLESSIPHLKMALKSITKNHLGLDLVLLEKAAEMAIEDRKKCDQLSQGMESILKISDDKHCSLDSDDDVE